MNGKTAASVPVEKPRVQTAARTSHILLEVARAGAMGISAKTLSENLALPRQVVYHIVHTLVSIGMLRRAAAKSYVLGIAVAPIAHGFRQQLESADYLNEFATKAAEVTGETAYVGGWVDSEILVLSSARGSAAITASAVPQGTAGDAHARASGKLLLAMSTDEEIAAYFKKHDLPKRTPNTLTSLARLQAEFRAIRKDFVAFDREEYAPGLSCMAVPIGDAPSQLVLSISAPTERFNAETERYKSELRKIAGKN